VGEEEMTQAQGGDLGSAWDWATLEEAGGESPGYALQQKLVFHFGFLLDQRGSTANPVFSPGVEAKLSFTQKLPLSTPNVW